MNSHLRIPLLALVLAGALAAPAQAATYQEGKLGFTVSGSWVASGPASVDCSDKETGELRQVEYPVTERVTFTGRGSGRIGYRGIVGRSIFFNRIFARPKVTVSVSRTPGPPAGCELSSPADCGPRSLSGVANPKFEGPLRSSKPVKLQFDFARTKSSFRFSDPFERCPGPAAGPDWWASAMNPVGGDGYDFQAAALDVASPRTFYRKRRQTFSGSATKRYKGDPGRGVRPSSATLKMKVGVTRTVTKSQPAFGN
jgi:hypothetical protein